MWTSSPYHQKQFIREQTSHTPMTALKHRCTEGLSHVRYGDDTSRQPPVFQINPTTCSKGMSFPDVVDIDLLHCFTATILPQILKLLIISIIRFLLVFTATILRHPECCIVAVQQCNNFMSTFPGLSHEFQSYLNEIAAYLHEIETYLMEIDIAFLGDRNVSHGDRHCVLGR